MFAEIDGDDNATIDFEEFFRFYKVRTSACMFRYVLCSTGQCTHTHTHTHTHAHTFLSILLHTARAPSVNACQDHLEQLVNEEDLLMFNPNIENHQVG